MLCWECTTSLKSPLLECLHGGGIKQLASCAASHLDCGHCACGAIDANDEVATATDMFLPSFGWIFRLWCIHRQARDVRLQLCNRSGECIRCGQQENENRTCHRPNETELSRRWRRRARLRSLILKSLKSHSSERPAVGWSGWLDFGCVRSTKVMGE